MKGCENACPRNAESSYMPVFLAGLSQARSLGAFNRLPVYAVSHQEGHIMAGLLHNLELMHKDRFLAVHFSGGTSEILEVSRSTGAHGFDIRLLSGGLDLHAGQLIDRVGVAMGLPFPSGKHMEELAQKSSGSDLHPIPTFVRPEGFSFSGAETRALAMVAKGVPHEDIAFAVLRCLANTLEKIILIHAGERNIKDVLLVGGVMANSLIKERLCRRLEHPGVGLKLSFADPRLSSDNAVGVAMLAAYLHNGALGQLGTQG